MLEAENGAYGIALACQENLIMPWTARQGAKEYLVKSVVEETLILKLNQVLKDPPPFMEEGLC